MIRARFGRGRAGLRSSLATGGIAVALLAATPAEAVTDEERAGARTAATAGADAFDAGRYEEALDLFHRAEALIHSPVHLLFIARSYAQLGQLVRARETLLKVRREGSQPDASRVAKRAAEDATKDLETLEPRIPHVTASVEGDQAAGATVTMDGNPIPAPLVGVPRPVDPGRRVFRAQAPGFDSGEVALDVTEGARERVVLTLRPAQAASVDATAEAAPGPQPVSTSGNGAREIGDAPEAGPGSGMRIGAYAALGVGVAGVAVGTIFGLKAQSRKSEFNELCPTHPSCVVPPGDETTGPRLERLQEESNSARTLSTVGFIAGGVGLAAGTALFFLSSDSGGADTATARHVTPWIGLGSAGVNGRF